MDQYLMIEQTHDYEQVQQRKDSVAFVQANTLQTLAIKSNQQILDLIIQKQQIIHAFSAQITRLKAQQIKSKKLINSLQQKIQKTLTSGTNTSNTFMIASEFKNLLNNFMTSTIPSLFCDLAEHPQIYALIVRKILEGAYNQIQEFLREKLRAILKLLKPVTKKDVQQNIEEESHLRSLLINYFQINYRQIFCFNYQPSSNQSQSYSQNTICFKIITNGPLTDPVLKQTIQNINSQQFLRSQEMSQFLQQLYQICIYMLLQQNSWQFVFDQNTTYEQTKYKQKPRFSKKQFVCIDGFVKDGQQVIYVLKGLKRKQNTAKQFHYHPNLKNFVLPVCEDQQGMIENFLFQVVINIIKPQQKISFNVKDQYVMNWRNKSFEDKQVQIDQKTIFGQIEKKKTQVQEQGFYFKKSNVIGMQIVGLTQKSEIINSTSKDDNKLPGIKQNEHQNCVINPQHAQYQSSDTKDKQNINNLNYRNSIPLTKQKNTQLHTKKSLQQKVLSKKDKKQKNSSTIDLTNQKRKLSQKQQTKGKQKNNQDTYNQVNSLKNYELPLGGNATHGKSSHKKKASTGMMNNKKSTSRKCSVGKIVSQSIQLGTEKQHKKSQLNHHHNHKEKVSLSQHSTILMKQSINLKHPVIMKDNFVVVTGGDLYKYDQSDKENIGYVGNDKENVGYLGQIWERPLARAKRSMKAGKNIEDKILSNIEMETLTAKNIPTRQERPLILREHKNNQNMFKLRQKYLIN